MTYPINDFHADTKTRTWTGHAKLPQDYFPPDVNKFNAYSIHGHGTDRVYRSLFPVPGSSANFHRLEYFQPLDGKRLIGQFGLSEMWRKALQNK